MARLGTESSNPSIQTGGPAGLFTTPHRVRNNESGSKVCSRHHSVGSDYSEVAARSRNCRDRRALCHDSPGSITRRRQGRVRAARGDDEAYGPAILSWHRPRHVDQLIAAVQTATAQFGPLVKSGDKAAITAAYTAVSNACNGCHT